MEYSRKRSEIIYSDNPQEELASTLERYGTDKIFLSTERNVHHLWSEKFGLFGNFPMVVLPSGEENKRLESVSMVWEFLSRSGADRKSLLINIGGGMLTDLCGFAASTFKRGIDFINIPTTLLSQVDASVGGKTGMNFNGLKNEIGTFCEPVAVAISTQFLKTLDKQNLVSGFAEMIKHGLIFSPAHFNELRPVDPGNPDYDAFRDYIRHSVEIKQHFVLNDPFERNIRKALNFGHTVGHAIESLGMEQNIPLLHGYAVAWGLIAELYLSHKLCGLEPGTLIEITDWITSLYGHCFITGTDYKLLLEKMHHDKKNESNRINFTLLKSVGQFEINQYAEKDLIFESFEFLANQ